MYCPDRSEGDGSDMRPTYEWHGIMFNICRYIQPQLFFCLFENNIVENDDGARDFIQVINCSSDFRYSLFH